MELKTGHFYEYGPFRLEPAEHRLTRDGRAVSLAPKAFELLVFLVQNPGRLVTKEQIMQAVWPGSYVEEANLTVSISVLRRALKEKEGDCQYIETIPKKGYRFTAPVREVNGLPVVPGQPAEELPATPDQPGAEDLRIATTVASVPLPAREVALAGTSSERLIAPQDTRRRWGRSLIVSICVLLIVGSFLLSVRYLEKRRPAPAQAAHVQLHNLAVLPLRNLRQNPKDDFLGYSLADAIITKLGPVSALTVRPSSVIEKYKGEAIDPAKVGAELNVDTLLMGTFIHEGDDLRITYQLIDVKTENILGKDVIDLKYDRLLAVQDSVTQQILRGLELNLSPSEAARLESGEPTSSLAYEYYLRGVDLMGSHEFPLAIKMLEKSVAIDPNYALTWAYLGQSYTSAAAFEFGGRTHYQKAQTAYERALKLEPQQLEASMFLANLLIDTGKVEQAIPLLRDALKSNPNHAATHWELGYAYRFAGMLQQSVEECERAMQIDPLVKSNGSVLNGYLYLGEYDKFLQSLPNADNSAFLLFYRGFGEFYLKDWSHATADLERAYQLDPTLYTEIGKALSDSIAHRDADGLGRLHQLERKIEQRGVGDPEATYKMSQAYAVLGDKGSALRMLRYSIDHGFFSYPYFVADPLLESLRGEPEYPQLINLARDRHQAFKNKFF